MFRRKGKNRSKYCEKYFIPTCKVVHKIQSKKHASMLIMQHIRNEFFVIETNSENFSKHWTNGSYRKKQIKIRN